MRILLVGGGSGGPVSPLLAVADAIKKEDEQAQFLFVGTAWGPEGLMTKSAGIEFLAIPAGKFRRYFSFKNFVAPFLVVIGFLKSFGILRQFKPDCVLGSGSFVQVPVTWAAYFLGIPIALHQQDVFPSLANRLCQVIAKKITVTFEDSVSDFHSGSGIFYKKPADKVVLTGNPFRRTLREGTKTQALREFNLEENFPTLLVVGGGTGAQFFNNLIKENLGELTKTVQIIHATGKDKASAAAGEHYRPYEFIAEMGLAYAAADIVLCRAGLSTITELSNLRKVSIIIPMPHSHQELNALYLARQHAALVGFEGKFGINALSRSVRKLLFDLPLQQELSVNIGKIMPQQADKKIAAIVAKIAFGEI